MYILQQKQLTLNKIEMKYSIRKKTIAVIAVAAILPALISTKPKTSGGHPSTTGGPSEQTCAQSGCHSSASVDPGTGVNTLIFPTADSTYVPGQTYSITLGVKKTGITKFGFEFVALEDSNETSTGQLVVTDANRTHIISGTINGKTRKYMTHSTDGTPALTTDSTNWSFDWTAPSSNVGTITFYYITNCTNDNGANTGDALYESSFQIKPQTSSSIKDMVDGGDIAVAYIQSNHSININYMLKLSSKVTINLFDLQGKNLESVEYNTVSVGKHSHNIELGKNISSGIYNLSLIVNNQTINKKIFIQ